MQKKYFLLKRAVTFILLFVFSLRPIYFVGNVLYYQCNIDYIIETYCVNKDRPELKCNGKCHLAKQLTAIDATNEEGKAIMSLYDSFFPVFSERIMAFNFQNNVGYSLKQKINTEPEFYNYKFCYSLFKPPIV